MYLIFMNKIQIFIYTLQRRNVFLNAFILLQQIENVLNRE